MFAEKFAGFRRKPGLKNGKEAICVGFPGFRTPAGTGCARPSNPCRPSICYPSIPKQKHRHQKFARSLHSQRSFERLCRRVAPELCRRAACKLASGPWNPQRSFERALEGPVSKPSVISGLAFVSFSGSTRESVKDKIRHSVPRPRICKSCPLVSLDQSPLRLTN